MEDVKRFFKEARLLSSVSPDEWFMPRKFPAPSMELEGDSQGLIRQKLVELANSLLMTAGYQAGDYPKVTYSYEPIERGWDPLKKRKVSRARASLLVHAQKFS